MSAARGRKSKAKSLLAGHQKSWIWGRHAVCEALRGGAWPIVELYLDQDLPGEDLDQVRAFADPRGIEVHFSSRTRLTELCHRKNHQGYLARMGPYPYAQADTLLERVAPGRPLVLLDGVQDPQNLGTILRSAEVLGACGVVLTQDRSVGITAAVARSSAGAVHHLAVAQVSLPTFLDALGQKQVLRLCASQDATDELENVALSGKALAWVIGNEAQGVSPEVIERCDLCVRIPQVGQVESLNAAMAAGIVLYETLVRHRRAEEA
jgi:23S rRNA (guanosine2251-2'-O)-methyltransferase